MYRLKTTLDCELLFMELPLTSDQNILKERMLEILEILNDAYGENRSSHSMGGYILFFPCEEIYNQQIAQILDYYHLDVELCEYKEIILLDSLQIFEFDFTIDKKGVITQTICHSQEQPNYSATYEFVHVCKGIKAKILAIDDGKSAKLLKAEEYQSK